MLVPQVITRTARGERSLDIFSSLLGENIICISGFIDDILANLVIAQILFLEGEDPDKEIALYLNSPGGSLTAALAVYDTMQYVHPDISTICLGQAVGTSAMLIAAGTPEKRFALPGARLVITQPALGKISGQATDIGIYAQELLRQRELLSTILAKHTKQTYERIEHDIERDLILSASQARSYGLIDAIYETRAGGGPAER